MTCTNGDFRPIVTHSAHRGVSSIVQVRTLVTSRPAFPAARPVVLGTVASSIVAMCSPSHRATHDAKSLKVQLLQENSHFNRSRSP